MSRNNRVTLATSNECHFFITNKTKTSVGGQMIRHNSIPALQTKKEITNSEVKGGE